MKLRQEELVSIEVGRLRSCVKLRQEELVSNQVGRLGSCVRKTDRRRSWSAKLGMTKRVQVSVQGECEGCTELADQCESRLGSRLLGCWGSRGQGRGPLLLFDL